MEHILRNRRLPGPDRANQQDRDALRDQRRDQEIVAHSVDRGNYDAVERSAGKECLLMVEFLKECLLMVELYREFAKLLSAVDGGRLTLSKMKNFLIIFFLIDSCTYFHIFLNKQTNITFCKTKK